MTMPPSPLFSEKEWLVTCGGLGIWHLIDIILVAVRKYPDAQGRPLA